MSENNLRPNKISHLPNMILNSIHYYESKEPKWSIMLKKKNSLSEYDNYIHLEVGILIFSQLNTISLKNLIVG